MKCQRINCTKEAEVVPILIVPCMQDHECGYEEEILVGAEVCRDCQTRVNISNLMTPEIAILFVNLMNLAQHEPDFESSYIRWVPLNCDEYRLFQKLRNISISDSNETSSKLLH